MLLAVGSGLWTVRSIAGTTKSSERLPLPVRSLSALSGVSPSLELFPSIVWWTFRWPIMQTRPMLLRKDRRRRLLRASLHGGGDDTWAGASFLPCSDRSDSPTRGNRPHARPHPPTNTQRTGVVGCCFVAAPYSWHAHPIRSPLRHAHRTMDVAATASEGPDHWMHTSTAPRCQLVYAITPAVFRLMVMHAADPLRTRTVSLQSLLTASPHSSCSPSPLPLALLAHPRSSMRVYYLCPTWQPIGELKNAALLGVLSCVGDLSHPVGKSLP
jgi:hypothetical protein